MMTALVLDTSLFTNPDVTAQWGGTPDAAFAALLPLARRLRGEIALYMPLSVYEELKTFLSGQVPAEFEFVVVIRSPERDSQTVPGTVLYHLIEDIRKRIDKGLRVAESAVREAETLSDVGPTLSRLRDRYRTALRAGLLDSREDVDLLLLSRELDAALVTADHGVREWAERLGIRLIDPGLLKEALEGLLLASERGAVE